jgi:hypothetical protein
MMILRSAWFSLLPVTLFFSLISVTLAQEKVAGYVSGTQEVLQSITLADGNVAKRIMFKVSVVTEDPSNPLHLASQDCLVTYIFSQDEEPLGGKGSCDGISIDGHLWWLSVELHPDGVVHWTNNGGVGKFANFTASGTTIVQAEFPDGKFIGRFEGTYSNK